MSNVVQIALFFSFEVDGVPKVIAESPALDGAISLEEAQVIMRVASRVLGQDLISPGENEDGSDEG